MTLEGLMGGNLGVSVVKWVFLGMKYGNWYVTRAFT